MNLPLPLFFVSIAVRTAIIFGVLVAGIRLFGKRQMGGLNLFDLVFVLLLGNAIQNAITHGSGNLGVGLVSAGTLLVIDRVVGGLFTRRPVLETEFLGGPVIIVTDGNLNRQVMEKEGISDEEVQSAMRNIGLTDLDQVHLAVLEDDGEISVIPINNT